MIFEDRNIFILLLGVLVTQILICWMIERNICFKFEIDYFKYITGTVG